MISRGIYTLASSPTTAPKMLVPEIVLGLLEEQANTISNKNKIKLVLRVLVENFTNQGGNKQQQANTKLNHASWINWGSNTFQ